MEKLNDVNHVNNNVHWLTLIARNYINTVVTIFENDREALSRNDYEDYLEAVKHLKIMGLLEEVPTRAIDVELYLHSLGYWIRKTQLHTQTTLKMNIYELKNLTPENRALVIETEAISSENTKYMKPLTPDELTLMKDDFSKIAVQKAILEDELRRIKDDFKLKLQPLADRLGEIIFGLKYSAVEMSGKLFLIPDFENRTIHYVDEAGNVINTRIMKPEERQYRLPVMQQDSNAV